MISSVAVRRWCWVHKWTSLVCTLFLLMLCLTGLPLIFHHEIDEAFSDDKKPADLPVGTPKASLDLIVESVKSQRPGEFLHFISVDPDDARRLFVSTGKAPDSPLEEDAGLVVDSRTAAVLGQTEADEGGVMRWMFDLHVEMFAGLPGKLFLGVMGFLFLIAILSGVVIYAPFMRERSFGMVRRERGPRHKWLDLHNLLGMSAAVWMLVVGATGVINTWADLMLKVWQAKELSAMVSAYHGLPPAAQLGSLDKAVTTAGESEPTMEFSFVAFPGTPFSSPHHYAVFMKGDKPLTARLVKPVLIDAQTGAFTDKRDMPWYVTALLVSQPLHFGDYGGLPLKIIWAVLDVLTIVILISGLYLWWKRRKTPIEIDLRGERETSGKPQEAL